MREIEEETRSERSDNGSSNNTENDAQSTAASVSSTSSTSVFGRRPRRVPSVAAAHGSYVVPFDMTSDEQRVQMDKARSCVNDLLLATSDEAPKSGWKKRKCTKKGYQDVGLWEKEVEKSKCKPDDMPLYEVRSSVRVKAPMELLLKILDCSVMTSYRSFTKIIYESLVPDTIVLYHSRQKEYDNNLTEESLAVRWLVGRCTMPMVADCDFCWLEYGKSFSIDDFPPQPSRNQQEDGEYQRLRTPSAVKVWTSIETKHCPVLTDSHRLLRCHVPCGGFLLYETDCTDTTDVQFYLSIASPSALNGNDRQWRAIQKLGKHMARTIGRLSNAVDAYVMSRRLETLRSTRWVENADRTECIVCYRRFHPLTRRRHHCRLCGEVICRDCSVHKDADLPTIGPTLLRICKQCDADNGATIANSTRDRRSITIAVDTTRSLKETENASVRKRFTTIANGSEERVEPSPIASVRRASTLVSQPPLTCPKPSSGALTPQARKSRWQFDKSAVMQPEPQQQRAPATSLLTVMTPKGKQEIRHQAWSSNAKAPPKPTKANFASTIPASSLLVTKSSTNQQEGQDHDHKTPGLERRPLDDVELYQDLFVKLCARACDLLEAESAAISLFTLNTHHEQTTRHFMAPIKSGRLTTKSKSLLEVSAKMQYCDPVLTLATSVLVLNTSAVTTDYTYAFQQLPFVKGPQRIRFYAGIPLVTKSGHWIGALAIFRSEPMEEHPESVDEILPSMEALACATMASLDERKAQYKLQQFMNAPIVQHPSGRQTEPLVVRINAEEDDRNEQDELVLDHMVPRATERPHVTKETRTMEAYKQQMRRLMLQARQTQVQIEQNAIAMQRQGVL